MGSDVDTVRAEPADRDYMGYVGPRTQYDFMGATQFRLLCSLGLRASHTVLDFGCGSLRAGKLLISYLDQNRYFGIEPNKWLIEDAIQHQVGADLIRLKQPQFDYNSDFQTDVFSQEFHFIIAQSIFSHAGRDLVETALQNFKDSLKSDGSILATFIEGEEDSKEQGWVYGGCQDYNFHPPTGDSATTVATYRPATIKKFAKDTGLFVIRLPWYHPRQAWYLFAKNKSRLPHKSSLRFLTGAVFFDPTFADSLDRPSVIGLRGFIRLLKRKTPLCLKKVIKRNVGNILTRFNNEQTVE